MGTKWNHAAVIQGGYDIIKLNANYVCVCSAFPTTRTEAFTTYNLGLKSITGIFSWGDAGLGDGSRKLTVAEITAIPISITGEYTYLAFIDGTRLLSVIPAAPSKTVYQGDTVSVNSFGYIQRQLAAGKWAHQDVLEKGFAHLIANANKITICSQQPSTRTEAYDDYCLGRRTISSSNFTWGTLGTDGSQKCTTDAIAGLQLIATGRWRYTCFIDDTELYAVTVNVTGEQVYSGAQINLDSKVFQFPQPAA